MANINVTFTGSLSAVEVTSGLSLVARALSVVFPSTDILYGPYLQATTTGTAVAFSGGTAHFVVVINQGTTNLTVAFTPAGGGAASSIILQPGEVFLYGQTVVTAGGITALTLTAATSTQPCEVLVAF